VNIANSQYPGHRILEQVGQSLTKAMCPQIERCPEKSEGSLLIALTISIAMAARHLIVLVFQMLFEHEWQPLPHPCLVVIRDLMN
jgi:hypothetical protein